MAKGIVVFYTRTGRTQRMAERITDGMRSAGVDTACKPVAQTTPGELLNYDAIVMGSPTQYGTMAWELKKLIDDTAGLHYKLDGVIGGAFSSSCHAGGGNETTILDILHAMLIHGMIIQGEPMYDHYGAVSVGEPSEDTLNKCHRYGERTGRLALKHG